MEVGNTTGTECRVTNWRTLESVKGPESDAKYSSKDFRTKIVGDDKWRYGETGKRGYLLEERVAHLGSGDNEEKILITHDGSLENRFFFALAIRDVECTNALVEQTQVDNVRVLL